MPVERPVNNISSALLHSVKKARDSALRRGPAMNAALGLDNFSRFLQNESGGYSRADAPSASMTRRGAQGPEAFSGPLPDPFAGLEAGLPRAAFKHAPKLRSRRPAGIVGEEIPRGVSARQAPPADAGGRLAPLARPEGSEAAVLALRSAGHRLKETANVVAESLGKLSALFESGSEGVSAIGYDRVGGTSYGKYQIASNTGSMGEFVRFLEQKAPALAEEFKKAGPANTGSRGGRMPEVWRAAASRDPEAFESLQHEFIQSRFYAPAADKLRESGVDEGRFSQALREVLFSTAVQHGPSGAARIVRNALNQTGGAALFRADAPDPSATERRQAEQSLIRNIYSLRQEQFGSSSTTVQKAVTGRLHSEMSLALDMLKTSAG